MSNKRPNGHDDPRPAGGVDDRELGRLLAEAGPRPQLPPEDLEQIRAGLREAWRTGAPPVVELDQARARRRRFTLIGALAATLAAAIGLTWWLAFRPRPAATVVATVEAVSGRAEVVARGAAHALTSGATVSAGASLRTAAGPAGTGGRLALRLTGGSGLRLDTGSRVRIEGPATVALELGALYIDSGDGRGAPIEVRTPLGDVRELGTRFAVRLVPGEAALVVRVRDGAVAATRGDRRFVARRGEELVVHADGRAETRPAAAWGPDWAWVMAAGPPFASDGRTVGELLDWVAAETGWRVEPDPAARERMGFVFHGGVAALPADRAAFLLLPGAALRAELREDGTLVVSASTGRTAR